MSEVQPEKNWEAWEMKEADETGLPRTLYKVVECPYKEECSKSSWLNGKAWSWESEDKARNYLARHLHLSQLHAMELSGACLAASVSVVEESVQTPEEREAARREAEASEMAKAKSAARASGGGGWGGHDRGYTRHDNPRSPSRSPRGSRRRLGASVHRCQRSPRGKGGRAIGASVPRGSPVARGDGDGGGADPNISARVDRLSQTIVNMDQNISNLVNSTSFSPRPAVLGQPGGSSSSGSAGPAPMAPLPLQTLVLAEQMATVPVSHLRLLASSIKQVRNLVEQMAVQIPVLSAAELTLQQHCAN